MIDVPTPVIHGDSDGIVPFEVSGKRSHESVSGSELVLLKDAPHGCNVTHAAEFNSALLGVPGQRGGPAEERPDGAVVA